VIVAAGLGRRFGGNVPKQFLELGGEPILLRAIRAFEEHAAIAELVVVLPPFYAAAPPEWLRARPVKVVPGGAERGASVWNGLAALDPNLDTVLVHDGARPFVTSDIITRVIQATPGGGAIAAVPVADTLKRVQADGLITETVERATLWQAQTPQGFPRALLVRAYQRARAEGRGGTDEAELVERLGVRVRVVLGSPTNVKITRPEDLPLAEALAGSAR
jgi:2-C-methyl-D-erythritol 4-phosphate cytidylyltransferase